MKSTDHNTMAARGRVHPHNHAVGNVGPYNLRIGIRSQPDVVKLWGSRRIELGIEQPQDETNFTMLRVVFLRVGQPTPWVVSGVPLRRVRMYRKKSCMEVRIRKRVTDNLEHPLPLGQYVGSCIYDVDGNFAVYTLQATSLRKEPEPKKPKTIVTPGDAEYDQSLTELKRTFPGPDGLARGGTDPGGLRNV